MLHERQVRVVLDIIDGEHPARILEVAPGPARVTRDVARRSAARGVLVDASLQMLGEASRRLGDLARRWRAVQGDAFALPVVGPFDLIYSFRLIRHFERDDRLRLYREIARCLQPKGIFIFDAVNRVVSAPLRSASPEGHQHYDALLDPAALRTELGEAGFEVEGLHGVQHRYSMLARLQVLLGPRSRRLARGMMEVVERTGGEPLEWIVVCRRA